MKKNKIIFCGFGKLGKDCMEKLYNNGYDMVAVLTHRDGEKESVDTYANILDIPVFYDDMRKCSDALKDRVLKEDPNWLISVNYRYIFEPSFIKLFEIAINLHGALLPKYRGRTPHVWSIINGEQYAGITAHLIDEKVDAGDIVEQVKVKIDEEDTGATLLQKYVSLYPELLVKSLKKIQSKESLVKQNEEDATYFGKRIPEMGYIDFNKNAQSVINFIRAQAAPYPGAYTFLSDGTKLIIDKIAVSPDKKILINNIGNAKKYDDKYYVRCNDELLEIISYRFE